jgi:hypothetical protein
MFADLHVFACRLSGLGAAVSSVCSESVPLVSCLDEVCYFSIRYLDVKKFGFCSCILAEMRFFTLQIWFGWVLSICYLPWRCCVDTRFVFNVLFGLIDGDFVFLGVAIIMASLYGCM